jgi:hypothetical protein
LSSNADFANVAPGAEGFTPDHPAAEHIQVVDADQGLIAWTRKKIAICGFASSTRQYIPLADPTWTIFALNQLYRHLPRVDVHFDIHGHWEEGNVEGTDHPAWLASCGIPVLMVKREPGIPTSVKYPVERLIEKHGLDYFTSTIAFEIAYALDLIDRAVEARASEIRDGGVNMWTAHQLVRSLYEEYTIGIFGVDLIVGTEYFHQKPCAEFWIGQAESRGIRFLLPPETALLKQAYRYGYQRDVNVGLVSLAEYEQRLAALEKRKTDTIAAIHTFSGAMQELSLLLEKQPAAEEVRKRLAEITDQRDKAVALAQTLDGAQQESRHLHDVIELRARGGTIPLGT